MVSGRLPSVFKATLCLLLSLTSATSEEVITSISGRLIPIHLVQKHFIKQLAPSDRKRNIIYELTENQVIQGPGLHLDLRTEAHPAADSSSPFPFTVNLNGKPVEASSAKFKTLRAKTYDVITDEESGEVLSITGNGLVLTPLHQAEFPGIYVNKRAFADREYDLSDDLHILEDEQEAYDLSDEILKDEQGEVHASSGITADFVGDPSTRQARGSCASGATHYLEIAVAYDNTFCALYGNRESVATKTVQDVVDKSNVAYAKNTCVQLALVHIEAHCSDSSDPYREFSRFSPDLILNRFQRIWIDSRSNVKRDAAYLITGFQDGSSVAGIAFISAACSTRSGYGWIEGPSALIFAHEVGHTLGGRHTRNGIMGAVATGAGPFAFSEESAQQFANYLDNFSGSSCVETTKPTRGPRTGTSPPSTTSTRSPPRTTRPRRTSPPATRPRQTSPPTTRPRQTSPPARTPRPSSPRNPPSPTRPPSGPGGKCGSGFVRNNALACGGRRLRQVSFGFSGWMLGRVRMSIQQRSGQFKMKYRATGRLYISKYRDFATTDRTLLKSSGETIGEYKTLTSGARRVETAWDANAMPKPNGEQTCCSNNLYIQADVEVCMRSMFGMFGRFGRSSPICKTISETYTTRIRCTDVCRGNAGGAFAPMSGRQECPSCN